MQEHIKKLCKNLEIEEPKKEKDKSYLIEIDDSTFVKIWFLDPGFYFHSNLSTFPKEKKEDLFIYLMRANLLAQGTGGSRIGMDKEENFLTLSYMIDYEVNYVEFKEKLEDFVNYITYWRDEIEAYKKKQKASIL